MYGFGVGREGQRQTNAAAAAAVALVLGRAKTAERVAVPSVKSYQLGRKRTVEFRVGFSNHFIQK